jgi:hypothetical protein
VNAHASHRRNNSALLIVLKKPFHTRGKCSACKKEFISRIRDEQSAEWEVRTKFDRHDCDQQYFKDRE